MKLTLKPGVRLACGACPTEVVVVRAVDRPVSVACGTDALIELSEVPAERPPVGGGADTLVVLGKRYIDADGTIELLCTKAGAGPLICDGEALVIRGTKPLPSSD